MALTAKYASLAEYEAENESRIAYLSGIVRPEILTTGAERGDLGILLTPNMGNSPEICGAPWGVDNGCFTKPETYSDERYLAWLETKREYAESCRFANAPDVVTWTGGAAGKGAPVGHPAATLERSRPMFAKIRAAGYPAALVASNGIEELDLPWDEFDAIFLGGDDEWKLGPKAAELVREARARGKYVHMGRVNSRKRLAYAHAIGCHSADGTYLRFGVTENLYKVVAWLDDINRGALSLPLSWYRRKPRKAARRKAATKVAMKEAA